MKTILGADLLVNIPQKQFHASVIVGILKMSQAKLTAVKVIHILITLLNTDKPAVDCIPKTFSII